MALIDELKDRADRLDAELLALSGRIKEIERESNEVHTCINALDLAEMEAEDDGYDDGGEPEEPEADPYFLFPNKPALVADEQDDASEFAEPMPDAEFVALDEQTCEPVDDVKPAATYGAQDEAPALNEAMQDEREEAVALVQPEWNEPQPTEGYAPVTNPEAQMFSHGIQNEQKPKPDPRARPFSHLFTGKPKVDA